MNMISMQMLILTILTASIIFYMVTSAQYVAYLLHKFSTKLARDYFKLYNIKSHEHDKHTKCLLIILATSAWFQMIMPAQSLAYLLHETRTKFLQDVPKVISNHTV